jgi:hypothetical protein
MIQTTKLTQSGFDHVLVPVFVVVACALVGTFLLIQSHAATPSGVQLASAVNSNASCLDDYARGSTVPGPNTVDLWSCNKTVAQSWTLSDATNTPAGGVITNANGLCLDVLKGSRANYAGVDLYKCNGQGNQKWYVNGSKIVNPTSGRCLDDYHSLTANKNFIDIYTCNGTNAQKWTASAIAVASTAPSSPPSGGTGTPAPTPAPPISSGGAGGSATLSPRSPYVWPFSWDSIWNIPIASAATYVTAGITTNGTIEDAYSSDYDSINPTFPSVTLKNARLTNGSIGPVSVHGDPAMAADGQWNTCSAFLGTDNTTVYQGQTTELTARGNPYFGGTAANSWAPVTIKGTGITGCHGGSGLSGLGGTLTLTDLTQSGPIAHALKVMLDGYINYSKANGGHRWPATNADGGYNDPSNSNGNYYGGSNTNVQEGSLLALPKSISPSSFSNPTVAKLARAMQDYGAYIVDTTATGPYNFSSVVTNYNAAAPLVSDVCTSSTPCGSPSSDKSIFSSQLDTLLKDLEVVTNNTSSTPAGGAIGASRCAPYAPQFTDGSDVPPTVAVVGC